MQRFYRLQATGISFEDMKEYNSIHAGDEGDERPGGLAACDKIELRPNFGGAWGAYRDGEGEVVVFDGYCIERIYDGALTEPVTEVGRFGINQWEAMLADGTAWELEQ